MTPEQRRKQLFSLLSHSRTPISGTALAQQLQVSRQVIVQDIALIRASGYDIISTNRGYILNTVKSARRVYKVQHTDEQLEDELCAIVDLGGFVKNVMVNHRVYGRIEVELNVGSRRRAAEFMDDIRNGKSSPLKNITSDYHYHTVTADKEEILDLIEDMLREKGYLVETGC